MVRQNSSIFVKSWFKLFIAHQNVKNPGKNDGGAVTAQRWPGTERVNQDILKFA